MSSAVHPRRTYLPLILAAACWGLGTVVSKRAVAEIPPLSLLAIQLASSLTLLALLLRARGLPLRDPLAPPILARLGLLNPGLAYALSLLGLTTITASLSVVLWALEPLLILGLAAWALHERVTPVIVLLSGVAVAGMVLVIGGPSVGGELTGVVLTVAGVAGCAVYAVITRRWIPAAASTAQVVLAQEAYALLLAGALVVAAWLLAAAPLPGVVSASAWASAVASGVLYYGLAYWFYLSGLRQVPASTAAASFYLVPVFGVAGGFVWLGERLEPSQWVGVVVVVAAIALILVRSDAAAPITQGTATAG